jgi:hypothetical protein
MVFGYAESKDRVTKELLIMVKKLDFSNFFDDTKAGTIIATRDLIQRRFLLLFSITNEK